MVIKIVLVGKTDAVYLQTGINVYLDRLKHYVPVKMIEIPELKNVSALSRDQIKTREGELILKQISQSEHVILLDEHGKTFTSVNWARDLEQKLAHSSKDIVFVVGGSYGFSEDVYKRANSMLSLSEMTFSHQLVRLIFVEQLYRAFTIIKGEPYHHE